MICPKKGIPFVLTAILALSLLLFSFSSCSGSGSGGKRSIEISPEDRSVSELVSTVYSPSELTKIAEFDGSMAKLNAKFPIECLREEGDRYRVSYLGSESVAVLWFNGSGDKILGRVYPTLRLESDFAELKKGLPLDRVRSLDPDGEYPFLYSERELPRVSYHCTRDGYLIFVVYDESNAITAIVKSLI